MAKNEEIPKSGLKDLVISKYEQIKGHVRKNKTTYIVGAAGILLATVTYGVTRHLYAPTNISGIGTAVKAKNIGNVFVWIAPKPRSLSYVVRCNENKLVFRSQKQAAKVMKLDAPTLSKHLNGRTKDVSGYTFERLGIGA